jgi:hypothetical protein
MHLAILAKTTDDRFLTAVRHYSMTKNRLHDLAGMVESAVQTVRLPECDASAPGDVRALVTEFIKAGSGPRGVAVNDIVTQVAIGGVSPEAVLSAIKSLIIDDECYQPQKGFVKSL